MRALLRPAYRCSFCGKVFHEVHRLIEGLRGTYICNECVRLCQAMLDEVEQAAALDAPDYAPDGVAMVG